MMPADMMTATRTMAERRLRDTCTIHRATPVQDDYGTVHYEYHPVFEDIPCGLAEAGSNQESLEGRLADRIGSNPTFVMLLPYDIELELTDRIIWTAPRARHFEVLGIPNLDTTYEVLTRVAVIEHGQG